VLFILHWKAVNIEDTLGAVYLHLAEIVIPRKQMACDVMIVKIL